MIAKVRVLESTRITPTVHDVKFEKPDGFGFKPVQFCGLEFPTAEGSIEYPMSLACSPTKPYLEFGARVTSSPWKQAFSALNPGDIAEVDGAFGHFVLDEASPTVLIAGGIGITPLKGMAEYAADRKLPIDLRLLYSSRSVKEMAYHSELQRLTEQNPRFKVVHTLTRSDPQESWAGRRGRIDADLLTEVSADLSDPVFYVCGTGEMVQWTYRTLRGLGTREDRIKYEVFRGYEPPASTPD